MAVTLKDVARESGVNISTASRALNNSYGVRAAHAPGSFVIRRPNPGRQTVTDVVGLPDEVVLVVEGHGAQNGAENLLLRDVWRAWWKARGKRVLKF